MTNLEPDPDLTDFEPEGKPHVDEPWLDEPVTSPSSKRRSDDADVDESTVEGSLGGLEHLDAFIAEQEAKPPSISTPTSPPTPTSPKQDREGLAAALKAAAGEWKFEALRKRADKAANEGRVDEVPVMKHGEDLFSLATSSKTANLGGRFQFTTDHVANARADVVAGKNCVVAVMLKPHDDAERKSLAGAMSKLTGARDVVLRTTAGDAAVRQSAQSKSVSNPVPAPNIRPGVMPQEVKDRLADHNRKILAALRDGTDITISYYTGMDFSVAGKPAGLLADQVKPHQDLLPKRFTFTRIAEKKWQETLLPGQTGSLGSPGGKAHFEELFRSMKAKCQFAKK